MWRFRQGDEPKRPKLPETSGGDYSHISHKFENLVLKGGGAKGIAYIGACKVLEEAGVLANIKRFAGTSAGAITATLLAIGMKPQEMLDELSQKNLMDLLDPPVTKRWSSFLKRLPHIPGVPSWLTVDRISMAVAALTERGVYEGEEFLTWFGDILDRNLKRLHPDKKGLDKNVTFDKLYHTLGVELCIVAYNMVLGSETYFHVKTTPMIKILDAVRMSMSIPVVFKPYEGVPGFTFIDGGLAANYPLWAFDGWYLSMNKKDTFQERLKPLVEADGGETIRKMFHPEYRAERFGTRNDKTLGILLFSTNNREMYQERFENRRDKLYEVKPELEMRREDTELYKKYRKERDEREAAREAWIAFLKKIVSDEVRELIKLIDGEEVPDVPDFPKLKSSFGCACARVTYDELDGGEADVDSRATSEGATRYERRDSQPIPRAQRPIRMSIAEAKNNFDSTINDDDIKYLGAPSKEKAFEMLMLDDEGKLTTDRLRKISENVGPLQLARRRYLGLRLVSSPRQYYSTLLEFVGSNSGMSEEDVSRSVAIDVSYVGTMDFDMAPEDMEFLMRQGAAATIAIFEELKGSI